MDSQYQQQYDTISSVARIIGLLNISETNPSELRLAIPGINDMHRSIVQQVHPQGKNIIIDSLPDRQAHEQLLRKRDIHVYYHVNGADISFTSRLLKTRIHNDQEQYIIAFPEKIKYRQRRSSYRVHVSLALEVTASFKDHEGQTHVGQLRDISAGGMKVQFTKVKAATFEQQPLMPDCTLRLPDDRDIQCTFKVRHFHENARKTGLTIGGSFVALEQHDKRALKRFIASLERRTLRELRA
jgi:c-di-GMP-binding flagellar brake protein YcgR